MNISVVIPAYKNTELFLKMLRHNIQFLEDCEIIIVNDDPSSSLQDLLPKFKNIKLFENTTNLGFGGTVNKGIEKATKDYILLLNTDVKLLNDSFKKALKTLEEKPDIFVVSFCQQERDGKQVGKNRIYWEKGFFQHSKTKKFESGINGWAEGGSCLIDRKKFRELQGFDSLYSPFYWEDIDLSYRAWKAGYTVLFDHSIQVEHHHESTIGKYFKNDFVECISYRNQFIFIWKNITDPMLILDHIVHTFKLNLIYTVTGKNQNFRKGFIMALQLFSKIMKKRHQVRLGVQKNDREITHMFYE